MSPKEICDYYGSIRAAARAIGISRGAIHKWIDKGYVPIKRQIHLEALTNGDLKAEFDNKESMRLHSRDNPE